MEERELLSFIISCCVMAFAIFRWSEIWELPGAKLVFSCFAALFASWGFSVVEALLWERFFNFLQHFSSGASGVLLALWCRTAYLEDKNRRPAK